jgi:CBS domain-containing protein
VKARELARRHPQVGSEAPADEAARIVVDPSEESAAVLAVDREGRLQGVVSEIGWLRFLLPSYVIDDESLAGVFGPEEADVLWRRLEGRTVSDLLAEASEEPPSVDGDATLLEVASAMVRTRSPLVVVHEEGRLAGAITVASLLRRLLREPTRFSRRTDRL